MSTPYPRDSGTQSASATRAAVRTVRASTAPPTTGLAPRPAALSRAASTASLLQPMDNCPASTAVVARTQPYASCPAATASPATSRVTATVGPGWQAAARAAARRGHRTWRARGGAPGTRGGSAVVPGCS